MTSSSPFYLHPPFYFLSLPFVDRPSSGWEERSFLTLQELEGQCISQNFSFPRLFFPGFSDRTKKKRVHLICGNEDLQSEQEQSKIDNTTASSPYSHPSSVVEDRPTWTASLECAGKILSMIRSRYSRPARGPLQMGSVSVCPFRVLAWSTFLFSTSHLTPSRLSFSCFLPLCYLLVFFVPFLPLRPSRAHALVLLALLVVLVACRAASLEGNGECLFFF